MVKVNIIGQKFGRLVVTKETSGRANNGEILWGCVCDCGNFSLIIGGNLRSGNTKSCGCTHNMSHSSEYESWSHMKQRCYNKENHVYKRYGGRGIKVCKKWKDSFENFFQDMGPRPSKDHSVERVKNNKGYSPSNCVWATPKEQNRNRYNNKLNTLSVGVIRSLKGDLSAKYLANIFKVHVRTIYDVWQGRTWIR